MLSPSAIPSGIIISICFVLSCSSVIGIVVFKLLKVKPEGVTGYKIHSAVTKIVSFENVSLYCSVYLKFSKGVSFS